MDITCTDRVLRFVQELRWSDLSPDLQHQTKRCLLDTLGALLAGARTPVGRLMADTAAGQYGGDAATILVDGRRVSAAGAALANGFAGDALDIDDGYRLVKGHPGACSLPSVLAAVEMAPACNGAAFLTALLVGYEVGIRAGLIRHATYTAYHSSGSWGAIAGAAAAGRLMGLNAEQLFHAMGCAEYHAPIAPMMKGIDTPSMGKDGIGWGCMVGVMSACMARDGFTGITPLFDDTPDPQWVEGLGSSWEIFNLYFKPYAACRWGQPAVAGALHLHREYGFTPGEINHVRVRTFEAAARLSCSPPKDTEEAQYNLAFPIAAALIDGVVGPRQVLPPRLHDDDLLELMGKISTEVDPDLEAHFPSKTFAEVMIETVDGRQLKSGPMEPKWEPPDTLPTDEELEAKFRWLVGPVVGDSRCDELVRLIWHFDMEHRADALIRLCT